MADKANLKNSDQPFLSDDDPFAELTRIMGFDPRQPVKPVAAEPPAKPEEVKAAEPSAEPAAVAAEVVPAEAVASDTVAATAAAKPAEVKPARPVAEAVAGAARAAAGATAPVDARASARPAEAKPVEVERAAGPEPRASSKPTEVVTAAAVARPAAVQAKPAVDAAHAETRLEKSAQALTPAGAKLDAATVAPAVVSAAATAPEAFGQVDLGIDLERELMGEFDLEVVEPVSMRELAYQETAGAGVVEEPVPVDVRLDTPQPIEAAGKLPVQELPAVELKSNDADPSEDLSLVEAEIAAEPHADDLPAFDEFDEAVADEMQRSLHQAVNADEQPLAEAAEPAVLVQNAELEFDSPGDVAADSDHKIDDADDLPSDFVSDLEPVEFALEDAKPDPVVEMLVSAKDAAAPEWELDDVFDGAVADAGNAEPVATMAAVTHDDASMPPALSVFRQMQSVGRKPDAAPVAAPAAAADEIALDASLEDELNALLGNTLPSNDASRRDAASELAASREYEAGADMDEEWEPVEPAAPAAPFPATSVADVAPAAADHWADARPVDPENQSRQNLPSNVGSLDEAPADDLDNLFDDHAFEAAISNAVAQGEWEAEPVRPVHAATNEPEESMPRDGHDPYAALAALSASLSAPAEEQSSRFVDGQPVASRSAGAVHAAARQEAPEIETVDVPEQAVALADDLDLPEFAYDSEPVPSTHYDDLDAEFTSLLDDMNASAHEPPARAANLDHREIRYDDAYFDRLAPAAAGAAIATMAARPAYADSYDPSYDDASRPSRDGANTAPEPALADMEFAYDPDFDEEIAGPAYAPIAAQPKPRRGLLIASVVGGVALLGGVAAFALSYGDGSGSTELALVKADPSPVKVKPENPGGTVIPNQDSKVYDSVAGAQTPAEPAQEKLLSSAEEPLEMPMPDDEPIELSGDEGTDGEVVDASGSAAAEASQPAGKATDRLEQVIAEPGVDESVEVAAVAPRKVRTMVVKADGTLVAREEPAPIDINPVDSASEGIVDPVASTATPTQGDAETTSTVPTAAAAATAKAAATPAPADAAPTASAASDAAAATPRNNGATPSRAPIAPARPSDQPVDIVGEVKPERVAALAPAAAAASGSWSMQIASQPTEAAAQSSYQDLLRRYGGVLGGHQATIVKAEIAGKGTFWRVRVPAGTRNDAIKLCESYKAAGGSCFVSK